MDCIKNNKRGVEILTDYCAGTLDPAIAAEIDEHSKQCAECRAMVEAQCAVWEMLDAWTPVEVSRDFDARLHARIASEEALPSWRRWTARLFEPATPYGWWKPTASLAAAGAFLALALMVRLPDQAVPVQSKSTTAQAVTSSEEIDLQQVQQALDDLEVLAPANQSPL